LAGLAAAFAAESPIRQIDVVRDGDTYVLDAVMFAPVPPAIAWAVLTDFDHMANWVPNVRRSRVVARAGEVATVEQVGVVRMGLFGFPFVSLRAIDTSGPLTIRSRQLEGSMRRIESTMRLAAERDGTRLSYHLELVPSLLAGRLVSETMLEREIGEQFSAIVAEMLRRRP
jgi:uncharacterized protein YndB with AHSA1/START domain